MTPDQIFVVREGTWNWVYYLGLFCVAFFFLFFFSLFYRNIKLLRGSRPLLQLAARGEKTYAILFLIWRSLLLWLVMVVASGYLICIIIDDCHNGFTSAQITTDDVKLNYLWPMPSKEIPRTEIQKVESKKWGNRARILVFTTNAGRQIKSVSGDADDVRSLCGDLTRVLGLDSPGTTK